jgi:hypothetical protein
MAIRLHKENPALFQEAIRFTAAETGFAPRLIEKDYYCSVLLEDLAALGSPLTFKGGTLLAKVHAGFYRLSEDLDFSISTGPEATKKTRSQSVALIKAAIERLTDRTGVDPKKTIAGSAVSNGATVQREPSGDSHTRNRWARFVMRSRSRSRRLHTFLDRTLQLSAPVGNRATAPDSRASLDSLRYCAIARTS